MHITKNYQEKCVMVRIVRRAELHQKNFTLKQHGSWSAARRAAKKWRDQQLRMLPPKVQNAKDRMTGRNHSGKVGVFLARRVLRTENERECEYWRWTARWPGCPYSGGIGWSIQTLGDDDAFALAVLSRQLETVSRAKVLAKLDRIYGTKRHDEIMALKAQRL